jgi:hypothetical protein
LSRRYFGETLFFVGLGALVRFLRRAYKKWGLGFGFLGRQFELSSGVTTKNIVLSARFLNGKG